MATDSIVNAPYSLLDPDVDGLKRLRLTPKLFDWLVDASRFFRWRRHGSFSSAIATQLIFEKNFPGWYPRISLEKRRKAFLPTPLHWLSLRCLWSNVVTLYPVHLELAAFIIFLHGAPRVWEDLQTYSWTCQKLECSLALNATVHLSH